MNMTVAAHAISQDGIVIGQFVGGRTLSDGEVTAEAIRKNYVTGSPQVVLSNFEGVFKSMLDGIRRDARTQRIDGLFRLFVRSHGRLEDICDPIEREKLRFLVGTQPLKELRIDTKGWTFVIEGATGDLSLTTVSTGIAAGEVTPGEKILFTGANFTEVKSIEWYVSGSEKHGSFQTARITSDATTITVDDPLAEIASAEYDGEVITFIVRMNGKKATKSAVLRTV